MTNYSMDQEAFPGTIMIIYMGLGGWCLVAYMYHILAKEGPWAQWTLCMYFRAFNFHTS